MFFDCPRRPHFGTLLACDLPPRGGIQTPGVANVFPTYPLKSDQGNAAYHRWPQLNAAKMPSIVLLLNLPLSVQTALLHVFG
jgi:hypothetical protein